MRPRGAAPPTGTGTRGGRPAGSPRRTPRPGGARGSCVFCVGKLIEQAHRTSGARGARGGGDRGESQVPGPGRLSRHPPDALNSGPTPRGGPYSPPLSTLPYRVFPISGRREGVLTGGSGGNGGRAPLAAAAGGGAPGSGVPGSRRAARTIARPVSAGSLRAFHTGVAFGGFHGRPLSEARPGAQAGVGEGLGRVFHTYFRELTAPSSPPSPNHRCLRGAPPPTPASALGPCRGRSKRQCISVMVIPIPSLVRSDK